MEDRVWTWSELVWWVGHTHGSEAMQTLVGHTETALATLALVADLLLPPKLYNLKRSARRYRSVCWSLEMYKDMKYFLGATCDVSV